MADHVHVVVHIAIHNICIYIYIYIYIGAKKMAINEMKDTAGHN